MEKSQHVTEMSPEQLESRRNSLNEEILRLEKKLLTNEGHDETGSNQPEDEGPEAQADLVTGALLGERIAHLRGELTAIEERLAALNKAA